MTVTAINNLNHYLNQQDHYQQLKQKADALDKPKSQMSMSSLKKLTGQFVNQIFYGTLMREFRQAQSPNILDRGPGALTFIRQLDLELIDRFSPPGDSSLTNTLIKQLSGLKTQNKLSTNRTKTNGLPPFNIPQTARVDFPMNGLTVIKGLNDV